MNAHGYMRVGGRRTFEDHRPQPAPPPEPPSADQPKAGLLSKAISWAKAEASLVTRGPLTDEEYGLRMSQCLSCPFLDPHPDKDKVGWCKECGCGRRSRAELTVKGRMPKATCPKDRWPKDP